VTDGEKEAMATVYESISGVRPDKEWIDKTISNVTGGDIDAWELVASKGGQAPYSERLLIMRACLLVMISDGKIAKAKEKMFMKIADALSLTNQDMDEVYSKIDEYLTLNQRISKDICSILEQLVENLGEN
ncbi:hypothetical protein ACFL3Q_17540, partial [Planctomycetota bacterium]